MTATITYTDRLTLPIHGASGGPWLLGECKTTRQRGDRQMKMQMRRVWFRF